MLNKYFSTVAHTSSVTKNARIYNRGVCRGVFLRFFLVLFCLQFIVILIKNLVQFIEAVVMLVDKKL